MADLMAKMIEERTQWGGARVVSDTSQASQPSSPGIASQGAGGTISTMTTLSAPRTGSYYIYSFDGRLLAEYDIYGACLRDYIYMGSRLVAEYAPATGQYFYYMQDQIGSTRVVTNDTGTVVYAEAHDPYGGIQKTWVSTFDPKRKFSDKERDGETGLDYFGGRYFSAPVRWADGHTSGRYRWLSIDPVLDRRRAMVNCQLWNLYAFCANNPITFTDPEGRVLYVDGMYSTIQAIAGAAAARLSVVDGMLDVSKLTRDDLKDPGVLLLAALATSQNSYYYSEGNSIMTAAGERAVDDVMNLDRNEDSLRYANGKPAGALPPSGIDDTVVIDPNHAWVDLATKEKSVDFAAVVFTNWRKLSSKSNLDFNICIRTDQLELIFMQAVGSNY